MVESRTILSRVFVVLALLLCGVFGHASWLQEVRASEIDVGPFLEKARSDGDFMEWMRSGKFCACL